jgi:predicted membrane protein
MLELPSVYTLVMLTLGLWNNKTFTFFCTGYILYPYLLIIFSTCFPQVCILGFKTKKIVLVSFFIAYAVRKNEMPKMSENKKI